jgi:hypothetical protein
MRDSPVLLFRNRFFRVGVILKAREFACEQWDLACKICAVRCTPREFLHSTEEVLLRMKSVQEDFARREHRAPIHEMILKEIDQRIRVVFS